MLARTPRLLHTVFLEMSVTLILTTPESNLQLNFLFSSAFRANLCGWPECTQTKRATHEKVELKCSRHRPHLFLCSRVVSRDTRSVILNKRQPQTKPHTARL
ncbi:hypothetical protein BDD12DRAFT_832207 [Trichophaea hybrida]|nr:hypothetical protein BDD12DRAFT_832207 [Trichophaea hybrida]